MLLNLSRPQSQREQNWIKTLYRLLQSRSGNDRLVRWTGDGGRQAFLVVTQGQQPTVGEWMLLATDSGYKARRLEWGESIPRSCWGVIRWRIEKPC